MTCELRFVAATLNVGGGLEFESLGSLAIKILIRGVWYNIELEMMVQYKKSDKITLNLKEFGKNTLLECAYLHVWVHRIYCSLQSHWNSYKSISIFGFTKQVSGKICIKKNVLLLAGWRLPLSLATFSVRSLFCHRMICYHVFISVSTRSVVYNSFMCISLFLCMVLSRSLIYVMLIKWLLFSSF